MIEQNLVEEINHLTTEIEIDKKNLKLCKRRVIDSETKLIEDVETRRKLQEKLDAINAEKIPTELTWEEQQIENLKIALPRLMEKIK